MFNKLDKSSIANRTQLLVSVQNQVELECVSEWCDVVDLKDPGVGALGAVSSTLMHQARERLGIHRVLSVALGDLAEFEVGKFREHLQVADFVKIGLARTPVERAIRRLEGLVSGPIQRSKLILVSYADQAIAQSPNPMEVIAIANRLGCRGVLIDTWSKHNGSVFEMLTVDHLLVIRNQMALHNLLFGLAGSIKRADLRDAIDLGPEILGIRGAVTNGARTDQICQERLKAFRLEMQRMVEGKLFNDSVSDPFIESAT